MNKVTLAVLSTALMVAGANAALITNGDWSLTQNIPWISNTTDTMADLGGDWYSSAKDAVVDGAYVEPIGGYGSGNVAGMKNEDNNYFQQVLTGVDAGIGEITVNYDGGYRWHSSYSSAVRDVVLRVSLWDTTTDTELVGVDSVYAYSPAGTSLNAEVDVLTYDPTGLAGNELSLRFENTSAGTDGRNSTALFDNVVAIPEPATLGMVALFGGGILFIRRKLML